MNRETKIGLFVLIAALVIGYFIMRTDDAGTGGPFWKKPDVQTVEMVLDDASGIRSGTAVRVAGVRVGEVSDLRLEGSQAIAVLKIAADLEIREDATVALQSQGVLGDRFVALSLGQGGPLGSGRIKADAAGASLDKVTDIIYEIGEELLVITQRLRESSETDVGANRIDAIAANLERLTQLLVETMEQNQGNVNTTMTEVAALSAELRQSIPSLVAELSAMVSDLRSFGDDNRGNADQTVANIRSLTEKMDAAMGSFQSVAEKVDSGKGMVGKLINDDETAEKLDTLLDEANASLAEVKNYLGQVNNIQLDLGFYMDYLEQHEAQSGAFQLRISPSDKKYYLVEAYSREVEYLPLRSHVTTETTFDAEGNLITTTIIDDPEEEDRFGVGAQLAYRFGDFFLRGGLIEGSAGGALDYMFLQDRGSVTAQAWDFNRPQETRPHLKVGTDYELGKGLRFRIGWDDALESSLASLYVGLGVRWRDDDLKPLLGSLGRAF